MPVKTKDKRNAQYKVALKKCAALADVSKMVVLQAQNRNTKNKIRFKVVLPRYRIN
jgi:hypothetical protein